MSFNFKHFCIGPSNPCDPNPCGTNAMCEIDNANPICFCPKGLTGNPFKNCSKYFDFHPIVQIPKKYCS
jgi:hypothetical protein